jgi:serine/threonine protein kinase
LLWRQLRHQNILALIGLNISIYPNNPLPALLSPWMEYGSLRDYVKRPEYNARHDIPLIVGITSVMTEVCADEIQLLGIAEGVQYLHSLAITHGDIKHVCMKAFRGKVYAH